MKIFSIFLKEKKNEYLKKKTLKKYLRSVFNNTSSIKN